MPASSVSNQTAAARDLSNPSPLDDDLEQVILHRQAEFEALQPEWLRLWQVSGSSPFQSPMWLIPWTRQFASDLRVLTFRSHGRLVGLVPLYRWHTPETGERKLLLVGAGVSDYLDILTDEFFTAAVLRSFHHWLQENEALWDRCDFHQVPPHSALLHLPGLARDPGTMCPRLDLRSGMESAVPPRQLEKLRYYRRRTAREGNFSIRTASLDDCEAMMQTLFQLHAARWQAKGGHGMLHDPSVRQFHLDAARELAPAGVLRLYAAEFNAQTIAVLYAFAAPGSTFYYLGGFDPAFDKLSPGMLLIGHAIEEAARESHCFDFLRGEESYKYAWGAKDSPTWNLTLAPASSLRSTPHA